jgi:hypothetical protein
METSAPESYIAGGQRLIFATSNPVYFNTVLRALHTAPLRTGSN